MTNNKNVDLESNVEYREWAFDAIGFPQVAYDDKEESNVVRENPKCGLFLNPGMLERYKTVVLLLDVVNILLDSALMFHLLIMAHYLYAGLMGIMTIISTIVLIWMKWLMYRSRKDLELPAQTILGIFIVTELFIFFVQKVTTILIFISVDANGDLLVGNNYLFTFQGICNIWTTILSGFCIVLLLILFIVISIYDGLEGFFERTMTICFTLPPICTIFDVCYMLYFAIDKVLLQNSTRSQQRSDLRDGYIFNMIIFPTLLLCTNVALKLAYASKGSKHDYEN